jgi:serine/threonine protein kinase
VVKKCESLKNGKIYAVKILKMDDQQIAYLKKNFINIESLNHQSITKYKGMYFDEKKSLCYLIMEYFPFPNLLEIEL